MRLRKLLVVGAILFLPWTLEAQDVAVSGTVADATDAVLPGVTVTATLTDTGTTFIGVTDALGHYLITALRTGKYTIKAELPGFSSGVRDNISLKVGQKAWLISR